jgi:hypothetical protein
MATIEAFSPQLLYRPAVQVAGYLSSRWKDSGLRAEPVPLPQPRRGTPAASGVACAIEKPAPPSRLKGGMLHPGRLAHRLRGT